MEDAHLLAVSDSGTWVVEIDTDFPTTTQDGALLRQGFVTLREGQALLEPPNSFHDEFVSIGLADNGELGLRMTYSSAGAARSGVFWNLVPIVSTNDPFPAHPSETGLVWNLLNHAEMNERRQFLVLGQLTLAGSIQNRRSTLARFHADDRGRVTAVELLATKGVEMPALGGDTLDSIPTNAVATSQNERGSFLCVVDGTVGEPAILLDMETVLAQTGSPSPVPGLDWKYLDHWPRTSINDLGEYAFTGSTEHPTSEDPFASLYTLVVNGELFAQEGTVVGTFSDEPMGGIDQSPLHITNSGDVFWLWKNEADTESALMRNHEPIVQANVTRLGAKLVEGIPEEDGFDVSPDGRFWIGRVNVEDLGETILLVDFGLVVPIPGCHGNEGRLRRAAGLALPGDHLVLAMDNGQAVGARPILFLSSAVSVAQSPCGIATPFGELLISLPGRFARMLLPTWDGANPSSIDLPIPNDVALVNAELFAQGLFVDIDGTPAEDFRATNGLRIQIGAP
jgi:hypothetical protein